MLRRLLIFGAIVAIIAGKYAWRSAERSKRRNQAMLNEVVPAMGKMSPDAITSSEWAYAGPLGELTLHFKPNGELVATSNDTESKGKWQISSAILYAYIPGAEAPHQAIFRKTTDELSGISPQGMEPSTWTATRVNESNSEQK